MLRNVWNPEKRFDMDVLFYLGVTLGMIVAFIILWPLIDFGIAEASLLIGYFSLTVFYFCED